MKAVSPISAAFMALGHTELTGVTPNQHHNQVHDVVGADHTVTGANWDLVALTGTNTLGIRTPQSNVTGLIKEALLKSDLSGYLNLVRLTLTDRLQTALIDNVGQHLTINPGVDLILQPQSGMTKLQPNTTLQSHNYASQVTGMRITHAGEGDFRYLFADEMHVKAFIADLEQALAGGQIISKSVALLALPFTAPAAAPTTISLRSKSSTSSTTSSITVGRPTGATLNDVLVAQIQHQADRTITAVPAGWNLVYSFTGGTTSRMSIYWKLAGSSEPTTYGWTFSASGESTITTSAWIGADIISPIEVIGIQGSVTNSTTPTAPAVNVVSPGAMVIYMAGFRDTSNSSVSATPPVGFTEIEDLRGPSLTWIYSAYAIQPNAGSTGSHSVTISSHQWTAAHIVLKPSAVTVANLTVRDLPSAANMQVFQDGDVVRLRQFDRSAGQLTVANCWGTVSGYINNPDETQTWRFTRSAAPNAGTMAAGAVIDPDSLVLDYGTDGNGFYEVNAIDGLWAANSPYLQFVRWTGHPATGQAVRLRAGQLRGLFAQDEFGIFAGTGTANTDRYIRLSDYAPGNGMNNLPFSLRNGGVPAIMFNAWNDIWWGPHEGDKRLIWDGTTLTIVGQMVITGGVGYGALSDRPTTLSGINPTEGAKLGSVENGATAGATWGTNIGNQPDSLADINGGESSKLNGIQAGATVGATWNVNMFPPARFGDAPAGAGLYLTPSNMGYWNGGAWKTWIDSSGNFFFGSSSGQSIRWNGTVLAGYNASNNAQWYASSADGKIAFGSNGALSAPAGILDAAGIALQVTVGLTDLPGTVLSWYSTPETRSGFIGRMAMGYFDLVGQRVGVVFEIPAGGSQNGAFLRINNSMYPLWGSHNHGPGSGLMADTVDGYHASAFALVSGTGFTGAISSPTIYGGDGTFRTEAAQVQMLNNAGNTYKTLYAGRIVSQSYTDPNSGEFNVQANGVGYGYLNYNYNGTRMGYLLWTPSDFRFQADGRYATIHGSRVGINTASPAFAFDVNADTRVTGAVRSDICFSLRVQGGAPVPSSVYGILYTGPDGSLYYIRPNGTQPGQKLSA